MGVRPENIGELQRQVEPANCGQRDAYIRNRKVPLRKKELVTQRIIHNSEQTSSFQMRGSYRVVIALGFRHSREAQKCDPQCGPQLPSCQSIQRSTSARAAGLTGNNALSSRDDAR